MKFNVEIDLDWVGEGETVSDTVQKEIIANIENRLSKKIMDSVAKATEDKINSVLTAQVGQAVSAKITELLEKPRTVTDRYGNVTKENWTLESMLIEEIEKASSAIVSAVKAILSLK